MARGGHNCPHCRAAFPSANPQRAAIPSRAPRRVGQQQQQQSISLDPMYQQEDAVIPLVRGPASTVPLQVSMTPEYPIEGLTANSNFHVRVSLNYSETQEDQSRTPLDIVCVVDTSASMKGNKLDSLKKAIEFVVSVMTEQDRLSIISFNSNASLIMNFKTMTSDMKEKVRTEVLPAITAGRGTKIYPGLQLGHKTLNERRLGRNDNSVMFLLTDGQDPHDMIQKRRLVGTMRTQGTALFCFGFGADHDSQHMLEISRAAEGSFIYIDTDDTVVDAFGGAIGSQQGRLLRNIKVDLQTLNHDIRMEEIQSGSYHNQIDASRESGQAMFLDMFKGERRDLLVRLAVPTAPDPVPNYGLMSAVASYALSSTSVVREHVTLTCAIERVDSEESMVRQRDLLVDADIFRVRCMKAMELAISLADDCKFEEAKKVLLEAKQALTFDSVAYGTGTNAVLNGMMCDLEDCLLRTSSQETYGRGGGSAMIRETFDGHSKQRQLYCKRPKSAVYQTVDSVSFQSSATASKRPPRYETFTPYTRPAELPIEETLDFTGEARAKKLKTYNENDGSEK